MDIKCQYVPWMVGMEFMYFLHLYAGREKVSYNVWYFSLVVFMGDGLSIGGKANEHKYITFILILATKIK